ncbi:MAG: MBL fold metallo-hydrolase [Paracoccaceae bacterium]
MRQEAAGTVQDLAPGLRGVIAPNPGPMTHWGTNTFIVGDAQVAIIDPGPEDASHLAALLQATEGAEVSHILVTHAHLDHSPLAARLSRETGAPVLAFGPPDAGQRPIMRALVAGGLTGGGEGVDTTFVPDAQLAEGDRISGSDWHLDVLHTPGHFAGHLAFRWDDIVLSGDHVMDWSSSLVSPPDGDLGAFMTTSARLKDLTGTVFYPAHGGALTDPVGRLEWLMAHRRSREEAICNALSQRPHEVAEITRSVYTDIPVAMLPAAERNVFAHLIDLVERNRVEALPQLELGARFKLK